MRPLAVLLGIVMGSAVALFGGLVLTLLRIGRMRRRLGRRWLRPSPWWWCRSVVACHIRDVPSPSGLQTSRIATLPHRVGGLDAEYSQS